MKRILLPILAILSIAFYSCQKAPEIIVSSPSSIEFGANGGNSTLSFTSNREWSVISSESWCKITPSSGQVTDGEIKVAVTCAPNMTYEERICTATIKADELKATVLIVQEKRIAVSALSLNNKAIALLKDSTLTLQAIVSPDDATDRTVTWKSSNVNVATVNDGVVVAHSTGTALITASSSAVRDSCSVLVQEVPKGATNLNILMHRQDGSVYYIFWAECNLGADCPEHYGDYYAWGEIEPYYSCQSPLTWRHGKESGYDSASYIWCNGSFSSLTKYNISDSYGLVDDKIQLDLSDDAAHTALGGKWRMPTVNEVSYLMTLPRIDRVWTTENGVKGMKATSKENGESIFLPAAGYWKGTSIDEVETHGLYWTSSLHDNPPYLANTINFDSTSLSTSYAFWCYARDYGFPIRPVTE